MNKIERILEYKIREEMKLIEEILYKEKNCRNIFTEFENIVFLRIYYYLDSLIEKIPEGILKIDKLIPIAFDLYEIERGFKKNTSRTY